MTATAPLNYQVINSDNFLKIISKSGMTMIRKRDIQSLSMVGDYFKIKLAAPAQSIYLNRFDITPRLCNPMDPVVLLLQPPIDPPSE